MVSDCPKPYVKGGSQSTGRVLPACKGKSVPTLSQLCCAIGPDLLQNCAGLAEPGKHPCHNKLVENLRPILLKAVSSVTGIVLLMRILCLIWPWRLHLGRCLLACLCRFEKQQGFLVVAATWLNLNRSAFVQSRSTAKPKSCRCAAANQRYKFWRQI